jgi:hypothetical protein
LFFAKRKGKGNSTNPNHTPHKDHRTAGEKSSCNNRSTTPNRRGIVDGQKPVTGDEGSERTSASEALFWKGLRASSSPAATGSSPAAMLVAGFGGDHEPVKGFSVGEWDAWPFVFLLLLQAQ